MVLVRLRFSLAPTCFITACCIPVFAFVFLSAVQRVAGRPYLGNRRTQTPNTWFGPTVGRTDFCHPQLNVGFALLYLGFVFLKQPKNGFRAVFLRLPRWGWALGFVLWPCFRSCCIGNMLTAVGWPTVTRAKDSPITLSPDWRMTFLSVNNGLFIYTPIWALFLLSPLFFVRKQPLLAWMLWAIFGIQVYLCASWWVPSFWVLFWASDICGPVAFCGVGVWPPLKNPATGKPEIFFRPPLGRELWYWCSLPPILRNTSCTAFGVVGPTTHYDYATFYDKLVTHEKPRAGPKKKGTKHSCGDGLGRIWFFGRKVAYLQPQIFWV